MTKQVGTLFSQMRDIRGSVLPMAATGILVSAVLVGGGVDMARAYKAKTSLQAACDSGVLAGRRAVSTNGYNTTAQTQASNYFNTNFKDSSQESANTVFSSASDDDGNTIEGTATTRVDTAVVKIFGFNEFNLTANCSASMGVGNSDVTMVLDTTGSMDDPVGGSGSQTKMEALRLAMKNFYRTVATATAAGNTRVRYGFVPYSSSVNVGHLINDVSSNYLVDTYTIQSRSPIYRTIEENVFDSWSSPVITNGTGYSSVSNSNTILYSSTQYSSSNNCNNARPVNLAWSNTGSPTTTNTVAINGSGQQVTTDTVSQDQTSRTYTCAKSGGKYYIYYYNSTRSSYIYTYNTRSAVYRVVQSTVFDHFDYKPVSYNTSSYKNFNAVSVPNGTNGASQSSTWAGCIEERATVSDASFSFSSLLGLTPSNATDLDIDTPPDPSDNVTKWAPMWPEVAYYRTSYVSSGRGGSYKISNVAISTTGVKAASYCPQRAQLLEEMSESAFDSYADSLNPQGSTYHDLGMIWGGRLSSPDGMFSSVVNDDPANGGAVARHVIFMTDGIMQPNYSIQSSYGIEFHDRRVTDNGTSNDDTRHTARFLAVCEAVKAKGIRVWVIAFGAPLTTELESCASTDSAFNTATANQLNVAFQEIANVVGELRVVQ
jgi:hypothetical protein